MHEYFPKQEQAGTTVSEDEKNRQDGGKIVAEVTAPLSVKQIKQILEAAGINYSDCTEKKELEELLAKLRATATQKELEELLTKLRATPGMGCAQASGDGRDSSDQEKVIVCDLSMWKEHMSMVGGGICCGSSRVWLLLLV